nr:hypothetical protein B0A51_06469 [Rachicladosporium sp. CCFEE 5018]
MSTAQNSQINGDSTAGDFDTSATTIAVLNSASSGVASNTLATLVEPSSSPPSTTGTSKAGVTEPFISPSASPAPPSTTVPQATITTLLSISTTTPTFGSTIPSTTIPVTASTIGISASDPASSQFSASSGTAGTTQVLATSTFPSSAPANGSSLAGETKNDKSNAAAIGGGVGGGVAVLLLSLMAAFLYRHRRRRDMRQQMDDVGGSNKSMSRHRSGLIKPAPVSCSAWNNLLPQPLDDEALAGTVRSLLDQIGLHVDNTYAKKETQLIEDMLDALAGVDTNLLPSALPDMMQIPALQVFVIKHCMAYAILSRIVPSEGSPASLVPPQIAE